jgi:hypothetical protein
MFGQLTANSRAEEAVAVPQRRPNLEGNIATPARDNPVPVYQSACPALLKGEILATTLAPLTDGECGDRSPLALAAIFAPDKINLSPVPQVNCRIATAMVALAQKLNEMSQATFGATVETIFTGKGYQCRRRNNLADGKISEHGFANAIDITGFQLTNGQNLVIKRDWSGEETEPSLNGRFLGEVHKSACKIFTTVLGPASNEYHSDHFHFDLGCHGHKCSFMICE